MKVFISWSGERSKLVAEALKELIEDVTQAAEPWMSPAIRAGAFWRDDIRNKLNSSRFGICCVTKDNYDAPWLLFEAGALSKTVEERTFVCPYLIDLTPSELPQSPLTDYQAKEATEPDTWDLIHTINAELGDEARTSEQLKRAFDRCWPDLKSTVAQVKHRKDEAETERPTEEMVEEILVMVRDLTRRFPDVGATKVDNARIIIKALLEAGMPDYFDIVRYVAGSLQVPAKLVDSLIQEIEPPFPDFSL